MMFYEYKVNYLPVFSDDPIEERGLVYAGSYAEAAGKIVGIFQDTLISMYLCEWDCHELVSVDDIKEGLDLQ